MSTNFFTRSMVSGGQSPASIESDQEAKPRPDSVGDLSYDVRASRRRPANTRKAETELIGPGFEAKVRQGAVEGPAKTAEKLDSQPDQLPATSRRVEE